MSDGTRGGDCRLSSGVRRLLWLSHASCGSRGSCCREVRKDGFKLTYGAAPRGRVIIVQLRAFNEREFYLQALVAAIAVGLVAVVAQTDGAIEPCSLAVLSLCDIALTDIIGDVQKGGCLRILGNEDIAQVAGEAAYEGAALKAFAEHIVEEEKALGYFLLEHEVNETEIVVIVQDVEVAYDLLISDVATGKADHLVEYTECIAHAAVGLLCNHVECCRLVGVAFLLRHMFEMADGVLNTHALEVVDLAA